MKPHAVNFEINFNNFSIKVEASSKSPQGTNLIKWNFVKLKLNKKKKKTCGGGIKKLRTENSQQHWPLFFYLLKSQFDFVYMRLRASGIDFNFDFVEENLFFVEKSIGTLGESCVGENNFVVI